MLNTAVGILNPVSIEGGQYTIDLHFQDGTKAKYLRVGDYVEASNGNKYEIITWSVYPSDFSSGGSVTTEYVDSDTTPPADTGFDSLAYTPAQQNVNPRLRTGGTIGSISVYSGQNYEYQLTGVWNDNLEAQKAQVGDHILDSSGKEFEISYLSGNMFGDPFRVVEREKEGQPPVAGTASLYRPTANYELYQGNELSDPARTIAYNKDNFYIDYLINQVESATGSGDSLITTLENTSGSPISAELPVCSVSGKMSLIDVSDENQVFSLAGITKASVADGTKGEVVFQGLIKNVSISGSKDDPIFIAKDGTLTTIKPSIGVGGFVAGDFSVYVGKLLENQDNSANLDLLVDFKIMGQF